MGFPLLEYLVLEDVGSNSSANSIANAFEGHPNVRMIVSPSELIVNSIKKCPKLEKLVLESNRDYYDENNHYPRAFRNVGSILLKCPTLKHLELENPSFWIRSHPTNRVPFGLETLKLKSIAATTLPSIIDWFDASDETPVLPQLKKLIMDVDYLHFPGIGINAIAKAAPNLTTLKLKFAILPKRALLDMASKMGNLKHLHLSKCEVWFGSMNWSHLLRFFALHMPQLESVSINSTNIMLINQDADGDYNYRLSDRPHIAMKSIKIFDSSEFRPDPSVLHSISVMFPNLTTLRMDISQDCFPAINGAYLSNLRNGLVNLTRLEFRASRETGSPTKQAIAGPLFDAQIILPKLKQLSLWCFRLFPHDLLKPNCQSIEYLCLNYPFDADIDFEALQYDFPNLKELEIRGMTKKGHNICSTILSRIALRAPRLKKITMEALYRVTEPLNSEDFKTLTKSCPKVKHFRTLNYIFPQDGFEVLRNAWPMLESLELVGNNVINNITDEWQSETLATFMDSHQMLRCLSLGVAGLSLSDMQTTAFNSALYDLLGEHMLLDDTQLRFSKERVGLENVVKYMRYSKSLLKAYPRLRKCEITGTLN